MEEIKEEESFGPKVRVVIANTPSYVGSHITGYDNAVKAIAQSFPKKSKPSGKLNVIPGFVDPGDIREIKRILAIMGVSYIVFPDTTDVFDAPLTPESGGLYPPGGTTIPDLVQEPGAGDFLGKEFGMPYKTLPFPSVLNSAIAWLHVWGSDGKGNARVLRARTRKTAGYYCRCP